MNRSYYSLNGVLYPDNALADITITEEDELLQFQTWKWDRGCTTCSIKDIQNKIKEYISNPDFDPEYFSGLYKGILRGML